LPEIYSPDHLLEGGDVEITATYPAGVIGDTAANLEADAFGGNFAVSKFALLTNKILETETFSLGFPEGFSET